MHDRARSRSLLASALVPMALALLACSGAFDTSSPLGDTGDPLDVPTEAHRGSGGGAGQPVAPIERPSLQDKLANITPRSGRAPAKARPERATEDDVAPEKPTPGAEKPEGMRGVKKTGARSWTVKQRLATRWEDSPYDLAHAQAHGEGWMLKQVRRGDAYHLGMKNKDVVLSVNGRKLKTKAQLLAAYLALKNKKSFEVVFLRKGKQMKHHYRIVD